MGSLSDHDWSGAGSDATTDPDFSIKDYIDLTQDEAIARTLQKEYAVQVQQRKRQEELDFRLAALIHDEDIISKVSQDKNGEKVKPQEISRDNQELLSDSTEADVSVIMSEWKKGNGSQEFIKSNELESQITANAESMSDLKSQIKTLEENNHSQKLAISKLLDNVKELESYKSLYYKSVEQLKQFNVSFTEKENYRDYNKSVKIKEKKRKDLSIKTSQDQNKSEDRYKVSKLLKGNRDLSVAQSMPWAQKQKDKESRPDYAYSEVVRKKDERKRMEASDCPCCKDVIFIVIIVL